MQVINSITALISNRHRLSAQGPTSPSLIHWSCYNVILLSAFTIKIRLNYLRRCVVSLPNSAVVFCSVFHTEPKCKYLWCHRFMRRSPALEDIDLISSAVNYNNEHWGLCLVFPKLKAVWWVFLRVLPTQALYLHGVIVCSWACYMLQPIFHQTGCYFIFSFVDGAAPVATELEKKTAAKIAMVFQKYIKWVHRYKMWFTVLHVSIIDKKMNEQHDWDLHPSQCPMMYCSYSQVREDKIPLWRIFSVPCGPSFYSKTRGRLQLWTVGPYDYGCPQVYTITRIVAISLTMAVNGYIHPHWVLWHLPSMWHVFIAVSDRRYHHRMIQPPSSGCMGGFRGKTCCRSGRYVM